MTKPDCLLMSPINDHVQDRLDEIVTIHRYWEAEDAGAMLEDLAPSTRYVVTGGGTGCPAAVIEALPKLELIASFGVGYDAIDVDAARAAGVRVTNTPDVLNDCVAEVALALMLALCHRVPQSDRYVRDGRWERDGTMPLTAELTGRRVGILGLGRIGKTIATRLQAMKMRVVYHGRTEQVDEPYAYYGDLAAMARDVDWLVLVAPGTPETEGIVSRRVLEELGAEGCLVNVARGSLVDEPAMVDLLAEGRLGGAALDVFADEPRVPERLRALENVVLMPHQGSASHKTRRAMGDLVVANLRAQLSGAPLLTPVV